MDLERLINDLRILKSMVAQAELVSINERVRTYQNVGAFILRHGRLDAIIEVMERTNAERA